MTGSSTVGGLIKTAAAALAAAPLVYGHGSDNPWDEAVRLVLGVTGLADDRANLACAVTAADATRIQSLLARRIEERVPLAYLLGTAWFAGQEFLIEPGVVVPRSPIGELIRACFEPWLLGPPGRILDLCCGSGCIGIAAALAFPAARVTLVELDHRAADLARRNVERHRLGARADVLTGDLFEPLPSGRRFDLILSNPPYVDRLDLASLPAEYRHEPTLGLDGGVDGLDLVRRILDGLPQWLDPGGTLVCEVGMSAPALLRDFPDVPFLWPELGDGGTGTVFILQPP